jgi:trimethylguanosine synthase
MPASGPSDGRHLVSAADLAPDDGAVYVVAGGALLTSVFLEDTARPRRRRPRDAAASPSPSDDDDDDDDDAVALRAAGLPTSFAGGGGTGAWSGGRGRRHGDRDGGAQRAQRPETTGLLPSFPDAPTGTRTVLCDEEEEEMEEDGAKETASSPPPSHARPRDPAARRYWRHRHSLWSAYDAGVAMDGVGWFSATPEALAVHHAARCAPSPGVVVDAFAGCGGNAVRLAARPGLHVIAVDTHAGRLGAAAHNARVVLGGGAASGAAARLECAAADFFAVAPSLAADAVFLSPPWGGPAYKAGGAPFDVEPDLGGCGVGLAAMLAAAAAAHAAGAPLRVAAFLPRTARLDQIAAAAPRGVPVEVERAVVGGRVKGVTAYFGAGARQA